MKKFFYSVLAAATMLFATTSCSQEEEILGGEANGNDTQKVTFTVQLPGEDVSSRAIEEGVEVGGGNKANRLIWALYEKGKTDRLDYGLVEPETEEEEGKSVFKANIDMVKGLEYNVLFFAYFNDACAFQLAENPEETDLTALKLKNSLYANQEGYDAFVKCHEHKVNTEKETTVELKRPFAQINAATTTEDLDKAKKLNAVVTKSELTIEKVPTQYDIMTGKATELGTLNYKAKNILTKYDKPEDKVHPNETIVVEDVTYEYLNMAYVLAGDDANSEASTHKASFKFYRAGEELIQELKIEFLPIERNHRTNVVGNLLTQAEDFKIVIDEEFDEPAHIVPVDKYEVSTPEELQEAVDKAQDGVPTTVTLTELLSRSASLATETTINIPAKKVIILDLNGFTLAGTDKKASGNFYLIDNRGTLTIKGEGTINLTAENNRNWNASSVVVANNPGGNLTIESGVVIEHLGGSDMAYGVDNLTNGKGTVAVTTIDGATIKSTYRAVRQFLNGIEATNELYVKSGIIEGANKSIWMQDPSANANTGKLVVDAEAQLKGDVYLYVTAGSTEWPVEVSIDSSVIDDDSKLQTANLPEGYNVIENEGAYTVVNSLNIANLASLKYFRDQVNEGVSFKDKTVTLAADIDLNNEQWIPISYFLDDKNDADKRFAGVFDGNNHTISNLKYHSTEDDWYVGLFGCTKGATIKNLTISNVDMNLNKGLHFAALVGDAAGNTTIENITINGDVKIVGDINNVEVGRIGCIVGGNSGTFTLKNITVDVNEGSYVEGNSSIGGVAGQLQGSATFENVQSNIDIRAGKYFVGGVIGLAPKSASFSQCSASGDVTLTAGTGEYSPYRLGGIAGSWADAADATLTLTGCSFTGKLTSGEVAAFDCAGLVGRGYSTVVDATVSIDDVNYVYKGNGLYLVDKTYEVKTAAGLVALSGMTIEGGQSVRLMADIDLTEVEFNGLNAWNPENNNTFDGQNFTVSNWTYTGGAADMGFIKNWVGPIKNVKFENCTLKTGGRSAVVAAKVCGDISNVAVNNCSIDDSFWACGIIAGLYNGGSISDCTVTASSVKSNGGTGGIVGVINETSGERALTNCSVSNSTIHNTGIHGATYSGGALVGMFNADGATYKIKGCKVENNKLEGEHIFESYPEIASVSVDEPVK